MAIMTVLVLLTAMALWRVGRRYASRRRPPSPPSRPPVRAAQHEPVASTRQCAGQQGAPPLTEDDVIAFGLALEATAAVVEELLADKDRPVASEGFAGEWPVG
jgi:hypothetical protein